MPLLSLIRDRIRREGPITVAEYVDLALYHEQHGYYASATQRSGSGGDFFTSVDLGPVFGELLAVQFNEMRGLIGGDSFDLVEAAAGNARLSRDVLEHLARIGPETYSVLRLHLVERAPAARQAHATVLGRHAARLVRSQSKLPEAVTGAIFANELLDALPPHLVVMRQEGLREIYVTISGDTLGTVEGPPSSTDLQAYLEAAGVILEPGWFAEVNLQAAAWIGKAANALERGFLLLIDYGHEARDLYSASHSGGTLTTFKRHAGEGRESGAGWLREPGRRDITSHVDLSGIRRAAESSGLDTLGIIDQMYFLLSLGLNAGFDAPGAADSLNRRLALKTLLLPGGLGSTHKVMVFSKGVGTPALAGLSQGGRLT